MNQNFGKQLDQEIQKRERDDLNLRNFKSEENPDKLKDLMHIQQQRMMFNKEIKDVKIGDKLMNGVMMPGQAEADDFSQPKAPFEEEESLSELDQNEELPEQEPMSQPVVPQNQPVILVSSETDKDPDEV